MVYITTFHGPENTLPHMARINLIEKLDDPEIAALVAKIRGARGGQLHVFYRALLHSPGLASGWFEFNNAVRFGTRLDDRVRELVIMRVAALTGCEYVWQVHEAQYAAAAGVTPQQVAALREGSRSSIFDARERALLAYVEAMTRDVAVPDDVFTEMSRHFGDRETVEVTVLVGAYNMQTRVLRALGIESWKP
jgi:4-carboxymuconolactone decarboxylase